MSVEVVIEIVLYGDGAVPCADFCCDGIVPHVEQNRLSLKAAALVLHGMVCIWLITCISMFCCVFRVLV